METPNDKERDEENGGPNAIPLKERNSKQTKTMSINSVPDTNKKSMPQNKTSNNNNSSKKERNSSGSKKSPRNSQVDPMEEDCECKNRTDENIMDAIPFFKKCHSKLWFKVFVFLLVASLNVADLISDWLLYNDVAQTEQGLVYGPTEDGLRYPLLAFSIIGSFTFTFEVCNLWWEIFRNNPWVDTDLVSAVTVWIEDVPQITINVVIVACREEAVSYFQLVKASVIILGALIRITVSLIKYCSKKALHDLECAKKNKESCRHVVYRAFIMVGLFLTLGGAISVFLFTQSERNPDGSINFKVPHSVIDGEFDDQKYFQNVSIFYSHKLVDFNSALTREEDINLIKITAINAIRNKDNDVTVKLAYDNIQATQTKIVVTHTDQTGTKQECFQIDRATETIQSGTNCASYIPASAGQSEIIFAFHFVKARAPDLIFGDITYNVKEKLTRSAPCTDVNYKIEDSIKKRLSDANLAAMHYFRVKNNIDGSNPTIAAPVGAGVFYHSNNLTDVTEIWKTGFGYCKSSGSMAPHFDSSLNVPSC